MRNWPCIYLLPYFIDLSVNKKFEVHRVIRQDFDDFDNDLVIFIQNSKPYKFDLIENKSYGMTRTMIKTLCTSNMFRTLFL